MLIGFTDISDENPLGHEIVVNTDFISKIEVRYYSEADENMEHSRLSLESGRKDLTAVRMYTIFVGGSKIEVIANGTKAFRAIEEMYKAAIK